MEDLPDNIVSIEKGKQIRNVNKFISELGKMFENAENVYEEYKKLIEERPEEAVSKLFEYVEKIRDCSGPRWIETVAGGPCHDWVSPLINLSTEFYSEMDKENREKFLGKVLNYFDGLNYVYVQNHVELMHDSWLVSDVITNRWLYWPGYAQYINLMKEKPKWKDFLEHIQKNKIESRFWLTFAILRPEYGPLDIRVNYYQKFPNLVDRSLDGVASIIYGQAKSELKKENIPLEKTIAEKISHYDSLFSDKLYEKIKEEKWIIIPRN